MGDETGVDKLGVDTMGSRQSGMTPLTPGFIPTSSTSHFVYSHFVFSHFIYCFYFSKIELNTFLNIIFYVSSLKKLIHINFQENN